LSLAKNALTGKFFYDLGFGERHRRLLNLNMGNFRIKIIPLRLAGCKDREGRIDKTDG